MDCEKFYDSNLQSFIVRHQTNISPCAIEKDIYEDFYYNILENLTEWTKQHIHVNSLTQDVTLEGYFTFDFCCHKRDCEVDYHYLYFFKKYFQVNFKDYFLKLTPKKEQNVIEIRLSNTYQNFF